MVVNQETILELVTSTIQGYTKDKLTTTQDIHQYIQDHGLFITARMDRVTINGYDFIDSTHRKFRHLYIRLCSQHIKNYSRKRHLQPLCLSFYDVEDTRFSNDLNRQPKHPHIHAIVIPSVRLIETFDDQYDQFQTYFKNRKVQGINSILIEKFDSSRGDLSNLITYFAKAYTRHYKQDMELASRYLEIYPECG